MKLSIGSGYRKIPGWTHLDIEPDCNPDIIADITKPLPLDSHSVEYIFCEEVITQIPIEACKPFLTECRRILRPSGAVRLLMPDLRKFLTAYFNDPEWLISTWETHVPIPLQTRSAAEVINRGIRMVGPMMYDTPLLSAIAREAGFETREVTYCQSSHPALQNIDLRKPHESASVYLELNPIP